MKLAEKMVKLLDVSNVELHEEDVDSTKLGILSNKAYEKVHKLDKDFVGTPDYMGLAYFWNHAYRHYLRDCTPLERQKVHQAFLDQKLDLQAESDKHEEIIKKLVK